jgi:uncharacterized protein YbjT (DUF2867 family)
VTRDPCSAAILTKGERRISWLSTLDVAPAVPSGLNDPAEQAPRGLPSLSAEAAETLKTAAEIIDAAVKLVPSLGFF